MNLLFELSLGVFGHDGHLVIWFVMFKMFAIPIMTLLNPTLFSCEQFVAHAVSSLCEM